MTHRRTIGMLSGVISAAMCLHAFGASPESASFTSVASAGQLNGVANDVRQAVLTGGFTLGRIDVSGSLTPNVAATWRTDATVLITAPGGATHTFHPFEAGTTFYPNTLNFSASLYIPGVGNPAGTWMMRFYERFDDSGGGASDATFPSITFTWTNVQPAAPASVNLGTLIETEATHTWPSVAQGDVVWARFQIDTGADALEGTYLDIDLIGSSLTGSEPQNDTQIALFDAAGFLIGADDDSGHAYTSQFSFGAGTRPANGNGLPFNGADGDLPAGVYYVAIGGHAFTKAQYPWTIASDSDQAGSITLRVRPFVPPPACPGDIDGDHDTDVFDFSVFAAYFGASVLPGSHGDLDGSGTVEVFDFAIFAADFGCPN